MAVLPALRRSASPVDGVVAILVFVAGLALYVRTLARSLLLGDGAEFQTLAALLAMTHPTGYPVYLLLGHVFTWIPFGGVADRVNLFSAVSAALTLALVYLGGRSLGAGRVAALVGPAGLGLSTLFWWHAVMAEVYTPASALLAAVLVLALEWRRSGNPRLLFAAGLLGGLSIGVHLLVVLAAPAVLLYLALVARRRADWLAAIAGAGTGAALTLAAFLLLDARDIPASYYNTTMRPGASLWGFQPRSFDSAAGRLAFLLSGCQFRWAMFTAPLRALPERVESYRELLGEGWARTTLVLIGLGIVAGVRPRRGAGGMDWRDGLLLIVAWLGMAVFVLNYDIGDIHVFYIPTYVVLAVLASAGAGVVVSLGAWTLQRAGQEALAAASARLLGTLLLLLTVWARLGDVRSAWRAQRIDFLRATPFASYPYPIRSPDAPRIRAVRMLDPLPDNAVLYVDWGILYGLYYVAHLEQGRSSITAHELVVGPDDYAVPPSLLASVDAYLGRRPVYFEWIPPGLVGRYVFTRVGTSEPLFRVSERQ